MNTSNLLQKNSAHQTIGLNESEINTYLGWVEGWHLEDGKIARSFAFKNYYETIAFVNAIAYVIHAEDHHPEIVISYNRCLVKYNTHSVNNGQGGISENDFICAAKINAVFGRHFHN